MAGTKLVGQNYQTPDIVAKVTGKAKYSEDFKADGMLFVKTLCSPMPHCRVKRVDATAALAMPGVKAILRADELPAPADIVTDLGHTIKANPRGEKALTDEPLYFGEPILAVAAVDELTAAEAIEKIRIELEPLPHCVDPLVSLRPGGPNARIEGNIWVRPPARPGQPPPMIAVGELKWSEGDFREYEDGKLPMGKPTDEWTFGDLDAGFQEAALVLDETFVTPTTSHQTLEPRSVLAYWQNGKLHVHAGTQSTIQTVDSIARWMRMDKQDIVFVSEYTGGGFGSKATGTINIMIPALLSKKTGMPVMQRITREEEHSLGGSRPSIHGRAKVGFARDGRITALDLYLVCDHGPYEQGDENGIAAGIVSLLYQPKAMRMRGAAVLTNTPPRRAQSQPGGMQGITIIEPILAKAARQLGIDQVDIRKINAPESKGTFGPVGPKGQRGYATSAFVKEALDKGRQLFSWDERMARSGRRVGTKVRGTGVAVSAFFAGSTGFDCLFVIRPDGKMQVNTGIGNLGTEAFSDVHRVAAEMMGMPWEKVEIVWGSNAKHLAWSCVSGGSQTLHAHTRAAHAAATSAIAKVREIAAGTLGGRPEQYTVADERVSGGRRSMTLAEVARKAIELGGKYDGHEVPEDVNAVTKAAAAGLAGLGLMGVARDNYKRDGVTHSFVAAFAEVEVDVETGAYKLVDYLAVGDVGTVIHPRSLGGQLLGRSMLGMGHALGQKWVYDQHYGVPLATRFYTNRPPTILDVPTEMKWAAVEIPDPESPVGAKGIGETPVAAGCCAILNALSAAVGDEIYRRAPVNADTILTSLENGRPVLEGLTAHI